MLGTCWTPNAIPTGSAVFGGFTGAHPDRVELHDPRDLQQAMRLARAYERRNTPTQLALPAPRDPRRVVVSSMQALPSTGSSTSSTASPTPQPFKRLSPAEMSERRK